METMLCSLHQATIGYQQARGSRWNMNQDMKKKPPYSDKAQEYYLDNETATPPPSREESPDTPVAQLPTTLPHDYATLRDENGNTKEKPPVSAPCFSGPDPTGTKPWLGIAVVRCPASGVWVWSLGSAIWVSVSSNPRSEIWDSKTQTSKNL